MMMPDGALSPALRQSSEQRAKLPEAFREFRQEAQAQQRSAAGSATQVFDCRAQEQPLARSRARCAARVAPAGPRIASGVTPTRLARRASKAMSGYRWSESEA